MKPYLSDADFQLYNGDAREVLREFPAESVHMCVTSPPFFGLRDYGVDNQIGLEATPEEWVAQLVAVFEEVRRVLRKDGTLWVECGESYGSSSTYNTTNTLHTEAGWKQDAEVRPNVRAASAGVKAKDLIGQPFLLAFALREAGWYWRGCYVWDKLNPMPESVRDRCTVSHSYILHFTKSPRYFFDQEAIRETAKPWNEGKMSAPKMDGYTSLNKRKPQNQKQYDEIKCANARSVWRMPTEPLSLTVRSVRQVRVAADEAVYGMARTTSPDCPVHAGLPDGPYTERDDEHAAAQLSRIESSGDRLVEVLPDGTAPTSDPTELAAVPGIEDSLALGSLDVATPHSTASSRTDPAPETSSPGSASAETPADIGDMSASPSLTDAQPSIDASRSELADSHEDDLSERTAGGIARRCTCSYTGEITEETGHYAAFPQALAERCIKAGTSERGCCPECGAPWMREVESESTWAERKAAGAEQGTGWTVGGARDGRSGTQRTVHGAGMSHDVGPRRRETRGWRPSCDCGHSNTVPAMVMDCFGGSGTTALVSRRLGRAALLIELNERYCELTAKRTQQLSLLGEDPPATQETAASA